MSDVVKERIHYLCNIYVCSCFICTYVCVCVFVVNPNDVTGDAKGKILDLHFDVKFGGIGVTVRQARQELADINLKGTYVHMRIRFQSQT